MRKVVVDTSIYIDYVRTGKGLYINLSDLANKKVISLYTPSIVVLELWGGKSMNEKNRIKAMKQIISISRDVDLTRRISEVAGNLSMKGYVLGNIDAAIAATTLELQAELATLNIKHFINVPSLVLFDPHSV